jgi:hypothetical protein
MKPTFPRPEFRSSRTSAAVLLALFTLVSPLSPLFAGAARAQGGARRPATGGSRAGQQPDKGAEPGGDGVAKSPTLVAPAAVSAAQLKVTMDDGVASGQSKRPGETITYTVTIRNTNPTDAATNVKFINDLTANANLTFVGGSVQTQPIARADAFDVLGNVRIDVPAASGLLANDFDPDTGGSSGLTITTAPTASARGGEVSINTTTGAFTYNPPAGYDGADSFQYTVTDATGKTDTATATFTVAGMIWFVDNTNAGTTPCTSRAAGCGRLTSPFTDLQSFAAAQGGAATNNGDTVDPEAGDNIFLYTGTANYTAPLTLLNTQKLIGQGATDTLQSIAGVTVPPHSDPLPQTNEPATNNLTPPTITSAAGGILLASGNTLRGFNVGAVGTAQSKIQGTNFGTLTVGKSAEPDVSLSGAGRMLNLTTGSFAAGSGFNSAASTGSSGDAAIFLSGITGAGALTFADVTVAGAAAEGIEVTGTSSDISFGAVNISAGTDGVSLSNNGGGTRTFSSLNITGGSGIGFRHFTGGGAVNVTGATTVTNPTGNGIDIQNSNQNLTFAGTTVNKGTTANAGVNLVNNPSRTVTFASLAVTTSNGTGLNATGGGTVNVTSAAGSFINSTGVGSNPAPAINANQMTLGLNFTTLTATGGGSGSGAGVSIVNVTGGLTVNNGGSTATSVNNTGGIGINVTNSNAAIGFGNTVVTATGAAGVFLSGNVAPGSVSFGELDINPDAGQRAFHATLNTAALTSAGGDMSASGSTTLEITGTSAASLTPLAMTIHNLDSSNTTGAARGVRLDFVGGNFTVNNNGSASDDATDTNIQNANGNGLEVTNTGAGTVSFGNTLVGASGNGSSDATGTGVVLTNNQANIAFGAFTINPDSGERGLHATDTDAATAAGSISVVSGAVTTTNNTAVEITGASNAARTPLNIQFTQINTTGGGVAANGIRLSNTSASGSPGGFRVLGNGGSCSNAATTCTGGRITATTGADGAVGGNGIYLENADNVRLTRMRLDTNPNNGIRGINVNTFVLDTSFVQSNGSVVSGAFHESGVNFDGGGGNGLLGNSLITNSDIRNNFDFNLYFDNNSGTLNLTISNCVIRETSPTVLSNDNIAIDIDQTATVILALTGSTFGGAGGSHLDFTLAGTANGHVTVTGNTMTGTGETVANYLGMNVKVAGGPGTWSCRYNISNNTMTGTRSGNAILVNKGGGVGNSNSTLQGTISGNTIGDPLVAESGASQSSGISVEAVGDGGTHTALVSNNQVRQYDEFGINLAAGEDLGVADNNSAAATSGPAAALNVTVTGNTVSNPGLLAQHGIHLNVGTQVGDNNNVCADIGGAGLLVNTVPGSGNALNSGFDIRTRQRQATQVRLPGYSGSQFDNTAVQTYLLSRNVATTILSNSNDAAGRADDGYVGGAACAQPAAPTTPTLPSAPAQAEAGAGSDAKQAGAQQPLVIPGLMITRQPQQAAAKSGSSAAAQQPAQAAAQAPAQPKAQSAKSAETRDSKGGEEKSKKGTAGKIGVAQPQAGMFEVNIGTLPANDEVTLTFQVTIAATLSPASANTVSNQGTVTADGSINKVSDDPQTTPPAAGDGSDATTTPIDKFEPAIDITSSDATTEQGESVTFTATLTHGTALVDPLPTGTVSFVDTQGDMDATNDEVLCANVALTVGASSSTAQCATTAVDAGTRTIAALYSGDGRYDPATDTVTQTVTACLVTAIVTSTADDVNTAGTLRHAITNACSGATITFDLAGDGPHTITLSNGVLVLDKNLTINNASGETVIVDGNAASRVFSVAAARTVGISNLTITNGSHTSSGGGAGIFNAGTLTLTGVTVTANSSGVVDNGGISNAAGATLSLVNSTVSSNTAGNCGGIGNEGTLTLTGSTVSGHTLTGNGGGGGICNAAGATLNLTNSTVSGNQTGNGGGGILSAGTANITGSTVSGNTSLTNDGGIRNTGTMTLTNSTVSGNQAGGSSVGGGITSGGTLTLVNVTVSNNTAGSGGGVVRQGGTVTLRNTIVAGNTATNNPDLVGTFTSAGNNLIGNGDGGSGLTHGSNGDQVGTTASPINPLLGPLASNGGPTQTHKLLAGSPALDAGNNCVTTINGCAAGDPAAALATDQRGFTRPADAADANTTDTVDIGAVEMQASVQTFADASIAQDTSHTVTDFSVGDSDRTLTVTATSDNQTLVPDANVVITAGSSADKRTLTVTPAAGETGTANITVTVTDTASGDTMSDTFVLTVGAAAPKADPVVTITGDTPDPSLTGQAVTVTFTVTGSGPTPTGNVTITTSNGAETCTASVATGQCDITLSAAGNHTLTATYSGDAAYNGGTDTASHAVHPSVTVSDATASEASELMTFTVRLSSPSTEIVTVDFQTADGTATAGADYTATSGQLTFQPGQTLQTISVPVTNDGQTGEPDETFVVNLTGASNANVSVSPPADNQATGTITEANNPGAILISEIRTSGPGSGGTGDLEDDFIELYNNSDSPVTVPAGGWGVFRTNGGCNFTPLLIATIPATTTIPARGHYLITGSGYSLTAVAGNDQGFAQPLSEDENVGLFSTADLAQLSTATRLDAVGFTGNTGNNCDLLREGTPLAIANNSASEHSFFRKLTSGRPQDTGANAADFQIVSTTPATPVGDNATPALGAPGPENSTAPIQRNDKIKASLIDPMQSAGAEPNSARKFCSPATPGVEECDANRSQFGTFSIRRRWTNNTGDNVTRLRFRIVNVTVGPAPAGTADLRAISSLQVTGVPLTGGGTVDIEGTTLEAPTQPSGGGFNSTLAAGTITAGQPLAPGASVNIQFLLGVQQPGAYRFFVNVEALPVPSGPLAPARQSAQPAKEGVNKGGAARRQ